MAKESKDEMYIPELNVLEISDEIIDDNFDFKFNSISNGKSPFENFEDYLLNRKFEPEKPYGLFNKDIEVCRFFESGFGSSRNENILSEIKSKNEKEGYGNVKIPNTNITLINYSFCPKCKKIYSFNDLKNYYLNPKVDTNFKNRIMQYREDTRVCCNVCDTYFLPSLIISDGTPKNEVQFLCRVQTMNAIERYFLENNIKVLTRKKENAIQKGELKGIKNDIYLKDLEKKPTLISNMLQYTPVKLIMNLIDGTNVEKGDILFNEWKWKWRE